MTGLCFPSSSRLTWRSPAVAGRSPSSSRWSTWAPARQACGSSAPPSPRLRTSWPSGCAPRYRH
ncbi:hypothetical protein T492DRAFT_913736, partial [Pavlovales sp. CCMP2436]